MLNIIKADLFRIIRGKGIYVCLLVIIAMSCTSIYLNSPGHIGNGTTLQTIQETNAAASSEEIPLDVALMQVNANIYYPIIFVVFTIMCVDLSNHTAKNVISTNVKRTTYYFSKLLLIWGLGIFLLAFSTYFSYFGNLWYNHPANVSNLGDITIILLRQIPIFCGIMSVLVMIAAITQKTARYNAIAILMIIVIQMLLMLVITIFELDAYSVMQYEVETIIYSVAVVGSISTKTLMTAILMGLGLSVGSSVIGISYFNRCDIK